MNFAIGIIVGAIAGAIVAVGYIVYEFMRSGPLIK